MKTYERHGKSGTPEYGIWCGMINRCHCPTRSAYAKYGARGIYVCDRWRNSFEAFLADMGPRPSPSHSIERKDNDGPYAPGNCVWGTRRQQSRNTRSNIWLTHGGKTMLAVDWAKEIGITHQAIYQRIKWGWPTDRVCSPRRAPTHHASSNSTAPVAHESAVGIVAVGSEP